MLKKFDIWNYKVENEADKKRVFDCLENEIDMTIDECNKVFDESGAYIADADYAEGDGVGIEYQMKY